MNTISKLLVASALVASFAAPALAVDYNSELQANTTWATTSMRTSTGSNAFAMDNSGTSGTAWVRPAAGQQRGFDQINGGM